MLTLLKYMKYYNKRMEDMFQSRLLANSICNIDPNYIPPKKSIYQKIKGYFSYKICRVKDFIKYVKDYNETI